VRQDKEVLTTIKLHIPAGGANPAPPVGPALGQYGVNIMEFCKAFNEATKDKLGLIIPAVITIYKNKSFSFILKSPPASVLLKQKAGLAKGSGEPNKQKVGRVTKKQIREICEMKMKDLNSEDISACMRIIEGTARSMGIEIVEEQD